MSILFAIHECEHLFSVYVLRALVPLQDAYGLAAMLLNFLQLLSPDSVPKFRQTCRNRRNSVALFLSDGVQGDHSCLPPHLQIRHHFSAYPFDGGDSLCDVVLGFFHGLDEPRHLLQQRSRLHFRVFGRELLQLGLCAGEGLLGLEHGTRGLFLLVFEGGFCPRQLLLSLQAQLPLLTIRNLLTSDSNRNGEAVEVLASNALDVRARNGFENQIQRLCLQGDFELARRII
mmetsp:Transcript_45146/g.98144  ORF Transcript_45146/g.98144 Transcript_45146/m.98144 type:complete len:230 (+) Transcript_45146:353-1042(+)